MDPNSAIKFVEMIDTQIDQITKLQEQNPSSYIKILLYGKKESLKELKDYVQRYIDTEAAHVETV